MRPVLRWSLLASVAASVGVLLSPTADVEVVGVAARTKDGTLPQQQPLAGSTTRTPVPWPLAAPEALAAWAEPLPSLAAAPAGAALGTPQSAMRPPAVAAAAVPALAASEVPPTVPAFPYKWIGRMQDTAGDQAFLAGPQSTLSVKDGDLIDRQWRVERVGDQQLTVVWLATGAVVQVRL